MRAGPAEELKKEFTRELQKNADTRWSIKLRRT